MNESARYQTAIAILDEVVQNLQAFCDRVLVRVSEPRDTTAATPAAVSHIYSTVCVGSGQLFYRMLGFCKPEWRCFGFCTLRKTPADETNQFFDGSASNPSKISMVDGERS